MNTKQIAQIISLTAVTVILNPRFSGIAIPFIPPLWFQIWEIVVVTALFLFGMKSAVIIAILNAVILQVISPGTRFNQPLANLVALLGTLLGVYLAYKIIIRKSSKSPSLSERMTLILFTFLGIILRLSIIIPFLYVQATILVRPVTIMVLPLISVYDVIVALYTIPLGFLIAKIVSKNVKLSQAKHIPAN